MGEQTREVIRDRREEKSESEEKRSQKRREVRREEKSEEKISQKRREVRREEKSEWKRTKSEEKRRLEPEMSDDHPDGEGSVRHEVEFVATTGDKEVRPHLPLEVDMDPDRPREDIQNHSGGRCPEHG